MKPLSLLTRAVLISSLVCCLPQRYPALRDLDIDGSEEATISVVLGEPHRSQNEPIRSTNRPQSERPPPDRTTQRPPQQSSQRPPQQSTQRPPQQSTERHTSERPPQSTQRPTIGTTERPPVQSTQRPTFHTSERPPPTSERPTFHTSERPPPTTRPTFHTSEGPPPTSERPTFHTSERPPPTTRPTFHTSEGPPPTTERPTFHTTNRPTQTERPTFYTSERPPPTTERPTFHTTERPPQTTYSPTWHTTQRPPFTSEHPSHYTTVSQYYPTHSRYTHHRSENSYVTVYYPGQTTYVVPTYVQTVYVPYPTYVWPTYNPPAPTGVAPDAPPVNPWNDDCPVPSSYQISNFQNYNGEVSLTVSYGDGIFTCPNNAANQVKYNGVYDMYCDDDGLTRVITDGHSWVWISEWFWCLAVPAPQGSLPTLESSANFTTFGQYLQCDNNDACFQVHQPANVPVQSYGVGGNIGFEPLDVNGNYLPQCTTVTDAQPIVTDVANCTPTDEVPVLTTIVFGSQATDT